MHSPLISIVIPCFNAERYLHQAFQSLQQQSYPHFEVICINDGSSDSTADIIHAYAEADARFKYFENAENKGVIYTLNYGLSLSQGTYIARLDADDWCMPNRLELQLQYLESHPEVAAVASNYDIYTENGVLYRQHRSEVYSPSDILYKSFFVNPIAHGTVMVRAHIYTELAYNTSSWAWHSEDYELWTRLMRKHTIVILPESLYCYRYYTTNTSSKHALTQMQNHVEVSRQHILHTLQLEYPVQQLAIACNRNTHFRTAYADYAQAFSLLYLNRKGPKPPQNWVHFHTLDIAFQGFKRQKLYFTRIYCVFIMLKFCLKNPILTYQWVLSKY